jgi:serine/threonine-protein kinase SRPK3
LNTQEDDNDDEFFGYEKVGDIRYIDRSFMDLGYIGYGDGIFLEKLDAGPNWQFS